MKNAVVSGASSGIGKEIAKALLQKGYYVFGFGRKFDEIFSGNFKAIICDFLDTNKLVSEIAAISKQNDINVLVNCAGAAYYGLHEELNPKKIHEMTAVNIEAPLVITQLLMRNLKKNKGHIINISSVTALKSNPHGAAYGATKAALHSFSQSMFDEARKYGVKVTSVLADMSPTSLYRNADFTASGETEYSISPKDIAQSTVNLLDLEFNVSNITLQPQKHKIIRKANKT